MKLIVGLGNPGPEYQFTPHNAGFLAVDRLAEVAGATLTNRRGRALTGKAVLARQEILLAKPETFVNLSGLSVAALVHELGLNPQQDLLVLYDELAFPLGHMKIAASGSANGHNGVKSISAALGTQDWPRIRIGVGKPPTDSGHERKAGGADYLLSPFRKMQLAELDEVFDQIVKAIEVMLNGGVSAAMNQFNRKPKQDPEAPQP